MAISEQWVELLTPGLRAIFDIQKDALAAEAKAPKLFGVSSSTKAEESDLGVGGFGDWPEYDGAISYEDNAQGFKTTYTHIKFVKGFKVDEDLVADDQYNIINAKPKGLALGAMRKKEKDAASVFNNAFDTDYLGGDAQSLCDGAHPFSPSNTASTQSNSGTTALSREAIIATRKLMRAFTDDKGELIQVMPDTLLVPPELEETAWLEANNAMQTDSADRNESFVNSLGLKVIVWDYLTDVNNWFLIDSVMAKAGMLNWLDRYPLSFSVDPTSDFRMEARYRGKMRYSHGWNDFKFVYGMNVA
ncbi:MAG: Mu-like prophage major head subunit gpT family protein [Deltaproteobacteria bacterium]|nr:Mu-like prophage major head subunit gpT family protein [Deltaproteobacteria bacterium]